MMQKITNFENKSSIYLLRQKDKKMTLQTKKITKECTYKLVSG